MTDDTKNSGVSADEAFNLIEDQDTEALLKEHQAQLRALSADADDLARAKIELEIASDLLTLERHSEAWFAAKKCLDVFISAEHWQQACETCDVLYQCDQKDSINALGHGVWLAVTYPVEAQTTIGLLQHIIDETPDNSDGAAVAAIAAHYIADLRATDEKRESLQFLTTQLIAQVAKRHSQVESQDQLDFWIEKLELKDPAVFLPRLASVIELMVTNWWFNRDALRERLPVH